MTFLRSISGRRVSLSISHPPLLFSIAAQLVAVESFNKYCRTDKEHAPLNYEPFFNATHSILMHMVQKVWVFAYKLVVNIEHFHDMILKLLFMMGRGGKEAQRSVNIYELFCKNNIM